MVKFTLVAHGQPPLRYDDIELGAGFEVGLVKAWSESVSTIGLEFSIEVLRAVSHGLNVRHASETIVIVFVLISNSYGIFAKLQISLRDK